MLVSHISSSGEVEGPEEQEVEKQKRKAVAPWSPWAVAVEEQTAEPSEAAAPLIVEKEEAGQTDHAAG